MEHSAATCVDLAEKPAPVRPVVEWSLQGRYNSSCRETEKKVV